MAAKRVVAVGVRMGESKRFGYLDEDELVNVDVEWHAPPAGSGDYATLCGVDADDPAIGHHGTVEAKPGQKITCDQCKLLWFGVMALKLRATDFA